MAIQDVLTTLGNSFVYSLPNLITAIVLLIIGFVLGKIAYRIVKEVLVRIKFDEFIIEKEKLKIKFSDIFSMIAKWVLYLIFIQAAAQTLGVATLNTIIGNAIEFIFGAIGATILILVGYSFAVYVKDKVISTKTLYGNIVGQVIFFLILYVSIALALPFLKIDTTIINWILLVIVASIGLGLAIALGLGLKDVIADLAKDYSKKFRRQ